MESESVASLRMFVLESCCKLLSKLVEPLILKLKCNSRNLWVKSWISSSKTAFLLLSTILFLPYKRNILMKLCSKWNTVVIWKKEREVTGLSNWNSHSSAAKPWRCSSNPSLSRLGFEDWLLRARVLQRRGKWRILGLGGAGCHFVLLETLDMLFVEAYNDFEFNGWRGPFICIFNKIIITSCACAWAVGVSTFKTWPKSKYY